MSSVGGSQVVTDVHYTLSDPAECCKDEANFSDFSYEFCMELCFLCCSKIETGITIKYGGLGPYTTPTDDVRDYPKVSVSPNGGLSFTTSEYGRFIPIVFGSDKLEGNVFWASPIKTTVVRLNNIDYAFRTVDFALGLCEGEINGVLRGWIGDKLMYDNTAEVDGSNVMQPNSDGFITGFSIDLTDPTSPLRNANEGLRQTKISVFNGSETQMPEGVMARVEGYDLTPGYRGLAYVLFENFIIAETNIPSLSFEVTANTQTLFPRLYGDLEDTVLDTWKYYALQYDPSFDIMYVIADKASGRGVVAFDGNSLVERAQYELKTAYTIDPQWDSMMVLPISGFLAFSQVSGNAGITRILNPFTGTFTDTLGPGGGITSHSLTAGFSYLSQSASFGFVAVGLSGLPADIICGVGGGNNSIGFAEISPQGQIRMASTLNNVLPRVNNWAGVIQLDAKKAVAHPTFSDAESSIGTHIYGFSMATTEKTSIRVWRVSVFGGDASIIAPVYVEVDPLSLDLFGGVDFEATLSRVMVDPSDNCFVLVVVSEDSDRGCFMAKYSPFTGELVWNTPISDLPTSIQSTAGPDWALLQGGKYVWIDAVGKVWQIDLKTGTMTTVIESLADQDLPAAQHAKQFYNGYENSLTYMTATATKHLVKVFIDRITRATVELSDIVVNLVLRTGLLESDIDVDDLAALTLNGYTITHVMSLHDAFAELQQAFTFDVVESNGRIRYKARGGTVDETVDHKYIMSDDDDAWVETRQVNEGSRVRKINLTYRDIGREYGANVQSVILPKYGSQVFDPEAAIDVTVPIVLTATVAKKLAEILLYSKLTYNTSYELTLAPRFKVLDPADVITLSMPDGEDDITMRLRQVSVDEGGVRIQASQENADIYTDQVELFGTVGRYTVSTLPVPPSRVDPLVMQIAGRSDDEISASINIYKLYIAWCNSRVSTVLSKPISVSIDGLGTFSVDAPLGYPTWGYCIIPPTFTRSLFSTDDDSQLTVKLMNDTGAALASVTMDDLLASDQVNLCYLGGELMQFRTATDLGNDTWRLTGLHRAKFGSDPLANGTPIGEKFVLLAGADGVLDDVGVSVVDVPLGTAPRKVLQFFMNTGDPFSPPNAVVFNAMNLRPWVVANTSMVYNTGAVDITWQRRTRFDDGQWPDDGTVVGEAVPLNEPTESYELYLFKNKAAFVPGDSTTYLRKVAVTVNSFTYTTVMQTADGFVNTTDTLYAMIYQTGSNTGRDHGASEVRSVPHA